MPWGSGTISGLGLVKVVVNSRFSGDPNVGRIQGTSLPTFGWFRYPSVGESSVRRLIAAAALVAAASGWN